MPRYKAVIAYDGTNYVGFQRQDNGLSVQEAIEKTLKKITQQEIIIYGSGRTDSGVHAMGQVIHFDFPYEKDEEKLRFALDTQTPNDIAVRSLEKVSADFHARYQAHEKTYHYRLNIGRPRNPFKRFYAAYYPYELDVERMQQAANYLLGTHDFTGCCASGSSVEDKVRTIYEASVKKVSDDELLFVFRGNGFLYKMIRILVGTLIKIGNGRLPVDQFQKIIETKDRHLAGPTAHPEGLYLMEVNYHCDEETC